VTAAGRLLAAVAGPGVGPWGGLFVGLFVGLSAGALYAGEPTPAATTPSCVEVSVNQHAVLAFDCLSRALASPPRPSPPVPAMDGVAAEPSNRQAGQFNFSAFSHRMGNQLGRSVLPQRPAPTYPPPLLGPRH
jgi:hypothetical protein